MLFVNLFKEKNLTTPKKHTFFLFVEKAHLDELEHVNNVVYFEFLQEAAIQHWYSIADQATIDAVRWVVRKHEIEYFKPAKLGDKLEITTWVETFTAISSLRKYEIRIKNTLIVQAATLWIALDTATMKPRRLDKSVSELFFE